MRRSGLALHIFITAVVGVGFYILGELLLPVLTKVIWPPLGIALYFLLFGVVIYTISVIMCKARGDYAAWEKKNLSSVVSTAWKRAVLGLVVLFIASGAFEFLYELEKRNYTKPSSYVFVIDDSGSMTGSDPRMQRVAAIDAIMAKEAADFPYAVYRFTGEVELVRDMAPYQQGEIIEFNPTGGTDIVLALSRAIDDIKAGTLKGGTAPKILLLSDGDSS
ncbi:MAG: VWA domain-containing protein, partial [Ruminococcaceae bacterium]|nr:VWA domain-containing protein [Oscillospiraceae bacterium]